MKNGRTIGWLLIAGALGVFIPYTMLTMIFEYPDILRQDTGIILTKFHEGGSRLIWTWFSFAFLGITLIPAYILIGKELENKTSLVRVATTIGVTGLIIQMIGLLRWTFVVPVLAESFVQAVDESTKTAVVIAFKTIHQYAGVLLGEHLGQLFTIIWTILVSASFAKVKMFPKWITLLGVISSVIYLLAQAELLATVMPGVPFWGMAGFIGSTLWLLWLITVGIFFIIRKP